MSRHRPRPPPIGRDISCPSCGLRWQLRADRDRHQQVIPGRVICREPVESGLSIDQHGRWHFDPPRPEGTRNDDVRTSISYGITFRD